LVEGDSEQIHQLLGLVVHLARMMPQPVGGLAKYEALKEWVIMQLTSSHLQLHYKCRALDLLVCLTGPQEDTNQQLRYSNTDGQINGHLGTQQAWSLIYNCDLYSTAYYLISFYMTHCTAKENDLVSVAGLNVTLLLTGNQCTFFMKFHKW
jgi:hypothetical protein